MRNKYQEAYLAIIESLNMDLYTGETPMENMDVEYVELIKELVDKETPMKPIKEKNSKEYFRNCPKCGDPVYIDDWNAYLHRCEYCGQKIDWNEDE